MLFEQSLLIAIPNFDFLGLSFFSSIDLCMDLQSQRISILTMRFYVRPREYLGNSVNYRLSFLEPSVSVLGLHQIY